MLKFRTFESAPYLSSFPLTFPQSISLWRIPSSSQLENNSCIVLGYFTSGVNTIDSPCTEIKNLWLLSRTNKSKILSGIFTIKKSLYCCKFVYPFISKCTFFIKILLTDLHVKYLPFFPLSYLHQYLLLFSLSLSFNSIIHSFSFFMI